MKRFTHLFLVVGLFWVVVCFYSTVSALAASTMTVQTSVSLSDQADAPSVNDSTQAITLTFSDSLNPDTIADGVALYRVIASGEPIEESIVPGFDNSAPTQLIVTKQDGTALAAGEEYKIVISSNIQSTNGMNLGKDVVGYFAVNYAFTLGSEGISELNGARSLIVCISDIHMGDARTIAGGYNLFEKNKAAFVDFLNQIRLAPNVKELVIAGDMLDEWIGPMENEPLNGMTEAGFVDSIAAANPTVIDAINNIIQDGQIKVTYIPGNHDLLETAEDLERIFPGVSQARDAKGLGAYTPVDHPEIVIEHGHRYEFFCAPDPVSNRSITKTESIMPSGFFFARVAYSSLIKRATTSITVLPAITINAADRSQYLYSLYWEFWNATLTINPVSVGLDDKVLKTGIDGYTESYAISDLVPTFNNGNGPVEMNLYQGVMDTWDERQTINQTPVKYDVQKAISDELALLKYDFRVFDAQSEKQYFKNPASNKRIVVFGHTHAGCVKLFRNLNKQQTIYANTGTWQTMKESVFTPMSFVVITPQKTSDSTLEFVTLYQYSQSGQITKLPNQSAITNLEPTACVKNGMSYK